MLYTVGDVLRGQHGNTGNGDRAQFQAGDHRDLPGGDARQHHDHPVAFRNTGTGKEVRGLIAEVRDLGEGIGLFPAFIVTPDQGQMVRVLCPAVDHVAPEIETVGQVPPKGIVGRGIVDHPGWDGDRRKASFCHAGDPPKKHSPRGHTMVIFLPDAKGITSSWYDLEEISGITSFGIWRFCRRRQTWMRSLRPPMTSPW